MSSLSLTPLTPLQRQPRPTWLCCLALTLATAYPALVGAQAASTTPTQEVSLIQALRAARQNLDVSLANQNLAAAQADIRAADHAPTPVLSAKLSQMDLQNGLGAGNVLTQKRIDKGLGVDWTWERGNKRSLRTRAAQRNAGAAQADVEDVQLQQLLAADAAYFDLLASQERQEHINAIAKSAAQLANTAALRVKAGDLAAQDAARTEIEAQRAHSETLSAELDRQRAALALAQLMGSPVRDNAAVNPRLLFAATAWPHSASTTAITPPLSLDAMASLVQARPDVRAAIERVNAAQAMAENAAALKTADITLGSTVDHFPGTSNRLLELRAQMPLQGWLGSYNYEGEIGRALAQQAQAQDALERARLMGMNELQRQYQELLAATQRTKAFETDIVPRARKVAEQAELAYNRGAMSLTDVLDARRTLRATLLDGINARAEHAKALGAWQLRTDPQAMAGLQP